MRKTKEIEHKKGKKNRKTNKSTSECTGPGEVRLKRRQKRCENDQGNRIYRKINIK